MNSRTVRHLLDATSASTRLLNDVVLWDLRTQAAVPPRRRDRFSDRDGKRNKAVSLLEDQYVASLLYARSFCEEDSNGIIILLPRREQPTVGSEHGNGAGLGWGGTHPRASPVSARSYQLSVVSGAGNNIIIPLLSTRRGRPGGRTPRLHRHQGRVGYRTTSPGSTQGRYPGYTTVRPWYQGPSGTTPPSRGSPRDGPLGSGSLIPAGAVRQQARLRACVRTCSAVPARSSDRARGDPG